VGALQGGIAGRHVPSLQLPFSPRLHVSPGQHICSALPQVVHRPAVQPHVVEARHTSPPDPTTQQPPSRHTLFSQQGCPGAPHAREQRPLTHRATPMQSSTPQQRMPG
jgi:hypothetical protein